MSRFERGIKERLNQLEIAKAKTAEKHATRRQFLEDLATQLQAATEATC